MKNYKLVIRYWDDSFVTTYHESHTSAENFAYTGGDAVLEYWITYITK